MFVAVCRLSPVAATESCSLVLVLGVLIAVALLVVVLFFLLKVFFFFFFPLLESIGIFIWKSGGEQVKCLLHSYLKTETISLASSPCW